MAFRASILDDRAAALVSGPDARTFLNGILTNDIEHLAVGEARWAALLTPQGKILFDMIAIASDEGFLLDTNRALLPDLLKRLGFYKLRAKVEITDLSAHTCVAALWDGAADLPGETVAVDPRLPDLGHRAVLPLGEAEAILTGAGAVMATPDDYHAHRIRLGVPEGSKDYVFGDIFPHEADMDQLNGVDFRKGCFVGQEVVARMQHKTVVRKRIVPVALPGMRPLDGIEVVAGGMIIGSMGSATPEQGLALLRLDRVADALAAGTPITAGGVPLRPFKPAWARFEVPGA